MHACAGGATAAAAGGDGAGGAGGEEGEEEAPQKFESEVGVNTEAGTVLFKAKSKFLHFVKVGGWGIKLQLYHITTACGCCAWAVTN